MDLKEFAKDNTKTGGIPCATCQLPVNVRMSVGDGRAAGIPWPTISAWLKAEHGITIQSGALRAHFVNHEGDA